MTENVASPDDRGRTLRRGGGVGGVSTLTLFLLGLGAGAQLWGPVQGRPPCRLLSAAPWPQPPPALPVAERPLEPSRGCGCGPM